MRRWGDAVTLEFVKMYLKHECLWNPAHPCYKSRTNRDDAYKEIVQEFYSLTGIKMYVPNVKTKIKNLRSTYSQTLRQIPEKSSADSIYKPSLAWFGLMDKCLKNIITIPLRINASTEDNNQTTEFLEDDSDWTDSKAQICNMEDPDPLLSQLEECKSEDITDASSPSFTPEMSKRPERKRKRTKPKVVYVTDTKNSIEKLEDEFDMYGKYLATQLRLLSVKRALAVKSKIHDIVNEARLNQLEAEDGEMSDN